MKEEFFDDNEVWLLVESGVEGEDGTRAFQTVACEVQLVHCVQILQVKFDGRTVWRLAHPRIEIFGLPCFEKQYIVAIVELGDLVELV